MKYLLATLLILIGVYAGNYATRNEKNLGQAVRPCETKPLSESSFTQEITDSYICIRFNNGNVWYKDKAAIQAAVALYGGNGSAAARKANTIAGLQNELNTTSEEGGTWTIDFDPQSGTPIKIEWSNI